MACSFFGVCLRVISSVFVAFVLSIGASQNATAQPTFTTVFSPNSIGPDSTTTLTYTINNTSGGTAATDLAFTNALPTVPSALVIASPANASTTCTAGSAAPTLTAGAGTGTISLASGAVGAGAVCMVSVDVTASAAGTYTNTTGDLTSSAGNSGTATDDLTVATTRPGFSKSATPNPTNANDPFTLTYTIDNSAGANGVATLSFSETFPAGITVASVPNLSTTCGASVLPPNLTAAAGGNTLSLFANGFNPSFPALAAGATCTVSVDLVAASFGEFLLTSGNLTAGGSSAGFASVLVDVTAPATNGPTLFKRFEPGASGPGGTVQLVFDIVNASRDDATNIAFTDDLDAFLTGAVSSSGSVSGCGGTLSGTDTLSFSGGTLASGGSCSITVNVDIPGTAAAATYTNTTSALTATVNSTPFTGTTASDTLVISAGTPLDLDIAFLPSSVAAGTMTTLRYTITNPNPTVGATDVAFSQTFSGFGGLTASSTPAAGSCGAGSSLSFIPAFNPTPPCDPCDGIPASFSLAGGLLPAGGMCTFDLVLDVPLDLASGTYTAQTSNVTSDAGTGSSGSAALTVGGGIDVSFVKTFSGTAAPGGTVDMSFVITNGPEASVSATNISFTDDLAAMLAGTTLASTNTNTCNGALTGTSTLSYSGGSLARDSNCEIAVTLNIPAGAATGSYTNTTSALSATPAGGAALSVPAATANLSVAGLTFGKEFLNDPVIAGDALTLRYTIVNEDPTTAATITLFTDNLSTALSGLAATGAATTNTCGGTLSGTTFLIYIGGSVPGGGSCTIEVPLLVPGGAANGTYASTSSALTSSFGTTDAASDALVVESVTLLFSKNFTDDPVTAGNTATLEFTIENPDTVRSVSSLAFTDDLDAALSGLVATGLPAADVCGAGSSLSGTSTLTLSGGTLAPGASCTFSATLSVPAVAAGSFSSTSSTVTGDISGLAVSGDAASDTLIVTSGAAATLSKAFSAATLPGGSSTLTFTIDNTAAGSGAISGFAFSDDLGAMLSGATGGSATSNTCGGTLSGSSTLGYTGGSVAAGTSCSIAVPVSVPLGVTGGTYTNTTSNLTVGGLFMNGPATADLTVLPTADLSVTKSDGITALIAGQNLTYTIVASNAGPNTDPAATLSDTLPSALTCTYTSVASGGATGNTAAGSGNLAETLSMPSGAAVTYTMSCLVDVAFAGTLSNTASITSSVSDPTSGNNSATDGDTVISAPDPLGFSAVFSPSTIQQGATSTLTFTLDNTSNPIAAANAAFSNTLPANVTVAATPNITNTCTGGTFTAVANASSVNLSGAGVPTGASCAVSVDVTSVLVNAYTNTTGNLTANVGNSGTATATLTVAPAPMPTFTKAFAPSSIVQGGVSTLTFSIDNATALIDVTALDFTDTFPAGMTVAATPSVSTTCTGGTLTATAATGSVSYTGGTVTASGSCTVSVNITSATVGAALSTSGDLTSSQGNSGTASATLTVTGAPVPSFAKAFAPTTIFTGAVSTLTFTVDNSAALVAASSLNFRDTFPSGMIVAPTPNPTSTCGGTVNGAAGDGSVSFSGGTAAASGSCTISVDVTATTPGSLVNVSDALISDLGTSGTATSTLTAAANPNGTLTIIQLSDVNETFGFTSSEAALNFSITTSGGGGTQGPVTLPGGTYTLAQSRPTGFGNSSLACSDSDSTGNAATGALTVVLAGGENVTCTYTSVDTATVTSATINKFLNRRIDLILSSEPSNSRRLGRLNGQVGGSTSVGFARGDLGSLMPVNFDLRTLGSDSYSVSGSLSEARQAMARHALSLDGDPDVTTWVDNPRFDVWFEMSYNRFTGSQGSTGHFAAGYIGADYLVNQDLLVGAMIQFDDLEDKSSLLNSTVSGQGWMFGPYVTARLAPNLYFDGRFAIGQSTNQISPFNTYTDTFETSRWLVSASVTGDLDIGQGWKMQPNAKLSYMEETQKAYVDSLAVTIPEQTVSQGQFRFGPNFSTRIEGKGGYVFEPRFTFDSIYNFGSGPGSIAGVTTDDSFGLRGRIEAGIAIAHRKGGRLELSANYDGIGQENYEAYGMSLKFSIPLK